MAKFRIFSDSCCDIPLEVRQERNIDFFYMGLVVDGEEKRADINWQDYKPEEFYGWLEQGKHMKTTQISVEEFSTKIRKCFEAGEDVLYLGCSSALTGSMNVLETLVKPDLLEEFPDRKIIGVDTLTAAATEGILVLAAADRRDEGKTIEEVAQWVEDNKFKFNQFATVETLTYLKNAGRIKGAKAFMGNLFHKKPIFISDRKGNNLTIMTVTGTKNADNELFKGVAETIDKENCKYVVICQGMAQERAERLKARFENELNIPAVIWWIGPIIGTTCGPGILATFCYGKEVTRYEGDGK